MKKIFNAIARYFKGVKKETGRIRWNTGKELVSASVTTVTFMIFTGVSFFVIDLLISLLRSVAA